MQQTMRRFNHNLVLKTLKQVIFPLVSYVQHTDCLAFESIWKTEKGIEMHRNERYVTHVLRRKLPMAWGTKKDRVSVEINPF